MKAKTDKTPEQVQKDIQDIMRQITSSVTFLPSLEEKCTSPPLCSAVPRSAGRSARHTEKVTNETYDRLADVFTILTYAKKDTEVPKEWIDSDPHMIIGNAEQVSLFPLSVDLASDRCSVPDSFRSLQVKLRSFSTNRHKVGGLVAYRLGQDIV